jgi:Brp/Blh family beta-carotene 15,15'-monooxygenase
MTAAPIWQTWLFVWAAIVAIVATLVFEPDLTTQALVLAPFVAVFGLPHGALDLPISEALWPLRGWRAKALFSCLYLGISGLVVLLWIAFPGPSLAAFLIYSAVHFSGDWIDDAVALRWSGGAAAIGAPAVFHHDDVARIFGYLAPERSATLTATGLAMVGGAALLAFSAMLLVQPAMRTRAATEQAAIWIAAALLTPLLYFIVYFCALHSVRHTVGTVAVLKNAKKAVLTAAALAAITALAAVASIMFLNDGNAGSSVQSISQTIFIGLAALTVPHMALVDQFQRRKNRLSAAL